MTLQQAKATDAKVAQADPKTIGEVVANQLRVYQSQHQIHLPAGYSAENAVKSAWYRLHEVVDRQGKPALAVCTPGSIAQAMLRMVLQGLNPEKNQCYFIVHGTRLTCMRSYMGSMYLAQQITKCEEPFAEIVYEGDEFEYEIGPRQKWIKRHSQKLGNIQGTKIKAAYCTIFWNQVGDLLARPDQTEIMTWEQIVASWKHSLTYKPADPNCPHNLHPEEFCKRTVINRGCKKLINSSSDSHLFLEAFNLADEEREEHAAQEAISEGMDDLVRLPDAPLAIEQGQGNTRLMPDESLPTVAEAPKPEAPKVEPQRQVRRQAPFLQ